MACILETPVPVSLVRCEGEDAEDFLHRLFSADIAALPIGAAAPAAWCQPNGRMAARVLVVREAAGKCLLALPQDAAAAFTKRLRMYVMRSRVTLSEETSRRAWGVLSESDALPACSPAAGNWSVAQEAGTLCVRLVPSDMKRFLWISAAAPGFEAASVEMWQLERIRACQAAVSAGTAGQVLPQSLGLDCLGGVSFSKGCYPGQEVVTSMKFRAKEVRRPACGTCPAEVKAGDDVLRADGTPCGRILDAAPDGTAWAVVAEVLAQDLEAGVTTAGGAPLALAFPDWIQ